MSALLVLCKKRKSEFGITENILESSANGKENEEGKGNKKKEKKECKKEERKVVKVMCL